MGKSIFGGRYTVEDREQDIVVFLIGMRVNKWRAVHQWWPVFKAMPPMIRELYTHPELGFLSLETTVNLRTILMVQYWRSFEELTAYARGPKHLETWRRFYQAVGKTNAVGIYHETYIVRGGQFEAVYGNMPKFGLAKARGHAPITPRTDSAAQRVRA
ncbi:transcriptional regulator [Paenibacillus dendritiformis]|uniref:DUF4188 domain-containing protein n=1 Tax=Paenibacillus TaxID=44249 RepID=UPI001B0517A6|nr:DUF4188 domain-containing protein [Paenibacillus dendritiformis]MEB9893898.1 DUF4188 domain-containing protein [Bacillus cereus]GIO80865.1 transcriptional regulator [Paenibacillus dendritiformis]